VHPQDYPGVCPSIPEEIASHRIPYVATALGFSSDNAAHETTDVCQAATRY